jgi:hypothetical protein
MALVVSRPREGATSPEFARGAIPALRIFCGCRWGMEKLRGTGLTFFASEIMLGYYSLLSQQRRRGRGQVATRLEKGRQPVERAEGREN